MLVLKPEDIARLAARLDKAEQEAAELDPLTGELPELDLPQAYQIQSELVRLKGSRGERIVGYKVGLTSKAKMEQMGVHSPICGTLTDRMIVEDGGEFPLKGSIHPRIEPEIAFRLGRELSGRPSSAEALAACSNVCAALEIVDSRFKSFKFTLPDVVADNCSSRAFVLGTWQPAPSLETLGALSMSLLFGEKPVKTGSSSEILGNPANSLALLCGVLSDRGQSLKRGSIVLAGAATEAVALQPEVSVACEVDRLGRASVSIR